MTPEQEAKQQERVRKLDELADFIIDDLVKIARSGEMSSADRKLILDFLRSNGLNLDPNTVPQELKDMMTSRPKFDEPDEPKLRLG